MEMIVALFIFVLIITTIVAVFVSSYRSQNYSQDVQESLENIRVSMEAMAKNIRTSNLDYPVSSGSVNETDDIYIYDYSQGKCIGYRFSNDGSGEKILEFVEEEMSRLNSAGTDIINCRDELQSGTFNNFIGDTSLYDGKFYVRDTAQESDPEANSNDGYNGQVTIVIQLEEGSSPFETSVSLRDY